MQPKLVKRLLALNYKFYERYAGSFSTSRYSLQPSVKRLLPDLNQAQNLLDVGCGNGNLALALQKNGFSGQYLGLDFSPKLLTHALSADNIHFDTLDLSDPSWSTQLEPQHFDSITCFAVLHHLPGRELQLRTFQNIANLLKPKAKFYLSVWQPLNSPKLRKRIIPWSTLHLESQDFDPESDLLLDWRAEDSNDTPAYRYVHQFSSSELDELAQCAGFYKSDEWLSDGREGRLALYKVWQHL